jgi:hypothetical protein
MLQLPTTDGNITFLLLRLHKLRRLFSNGGDSDRVLPVTRFDSPLLRMLNIGVMASLFELPGSGLQSAGDVNGLHLYNVRDPMPRFFLVPRIRSSSGEAATGTVAVSLYEPGRIELSVMASGPHFSPHPSLCIPAGKRP